MNTFPKEFIEPAKFHAKRRASMNASIREGNKLFTVEDPNFVDFIGVLGEIIVAFEMIKKGKAFFMNPLFDEKQVFGPDLIVKENGTTYNIDVKTTIKEHCCVPVHKLEKAKKHDISHYWFINLNLKNYTFRQFFCSVESVKAWCIVERFGYPCYLSNQKP